MAWFNNLKIQVKLLSAFAVVIAMLGIGVFFALRALQSSTSDMSEIYNVQLKSFAMLDDAKFNFGISNSKLRDAVLANTVPDADKAAGEADTALKETRELLTKFRATLTPGPNVVATDALLANVDLIAIARSHVFDLTRAGKPEEAEVVMRGGFKGEVAGGVLVGKMYGELIR